MQRAKAPQSPLTAPLTAPSTAASSAPWSVALAIGALSITSVLACGLDAVGQATIPMTSDEGEAGSEPSLPPTSESPDRDAAADPGDDGSAVVDASDEPPPMSPVLTLQTATRPTALDLDVEGTAGWIHWGEKKNEPSTVNRRADALDAIPTFTVTTTSGNPDLRTYDDDITSFRWVGGSPQATEPGTPTGVYCKGKHPTFTLNLKTSTVTRRLAVYAGVFDGKGRFTAKLGTGASPPPVSADFDSPDKINGRSQTFIVDYRGLDSVTDLVLTWELDTAYDDNNSNVTLAAATLRNVP